MIGREFVDIDRIGKWLMFDLNDYYLLSHLRMEGKYFVKKSTDEIIKHEHIIISFDDGTDLRYHDTRKFGRMNLVKKVILIKWKLSKNKVLKLIVINLLKSIYMIKYIKRIYLLKVYFLDQTIISGLGNIYANEVMFDARINPNKLGKDISLKECDLIVKASKKIIDAAIKDGGTTIKSYTSSLGVTGRFQQHLMVHKREGEECKVCGTLIENIKIGGRSTYFCPKCQK